MKSLNACPVPYWSGLRRWGIREILWSQEEYHRRVDELYRSRTEINGYLVPQPHVELGAKPGYSISLKTRRFVEHWIALIRQSSATLLTSREACALIRAREMPLKGPRSRFKNKSALEQWSGYAGTLRLVYRWHNVQIVLKDLAHGLRREEC
ncbi:DUF6361 family protein [Erwinia persicina]|uniref:DUF6361 family protein n=1 Tax=Erwinia persicina TaxID=55211 RepID=UPI0030CC6019